MAVKIRLTRRGKLNAASYRIIVADGRSPRDGKFIEVIGFYNPRLKEETVNLEKLDKWVANGAQASDTVKAIANRVRSGRKLIIEAPKNIQPGSAK